VQLVTLLFAEGSFDLFAILRFEVDMFPIEAIGDIHSGTDSFGEVVLEECVTVQDLHRVLAVLKSQEVDTEVAPAPNWLERGEILDTYQARSARG
jgi:hypothetical protein